MSEVQRRKYSQEERTAIFDGEFMPHIDSMYNFAFRLTFDEDDAKDLVQDTFFAGLNSMETELVQKRCPVVSAGPSSKLMAISFFSVVALQTILIKKLEPT